MTSSSSRPPPDGGYPADSDLHRMSDDGGPVGPDPARWADPVWSDDAPLATGPQELASCRRAIEVAFDEAAAWVGEEPAAPPAEPLAGREEEVLKLTARGGSPQGIADRQDRPVGAVRAERDRAIAKLGLRTWRGVVQYAGRRGWLVSVR